MVMENLNKPTDPEDTEFQFRKQGKVIAESAKGIENLSICIHRLNQKWWDKDHEGIPTRNKGEAIALMHSELSEALEGIRKNTQDEHLPEFLSEEVELADTIIRILDYSQGFKLRVMEALIAKLEYNSRRSDHKKENRYKKHGKKF